MLIATSIAAVAQPACAQQAPPRAEASPSDDGLTLSGSARVR